MQNIGGCKSEEYAFVCWHLSQERVRGWNISLCIVSDVMLSQPLPSYPPATAAK